MAALAMQQAMEQDSEEPQWLKERDRLLLLIPDQPATILQVKGHPLPSRLTDCPLTLLTGLDHRRNVQKGAGWRCKMFP